MDIKDLDSNTARRIIETVTHGNPPEYGFQYFTAGLDKFVNVLNDDYLASYIKEGGSAFKMVIGTYGSGKTHLLYILREKSWEYNYMASYIELSPQSTPFSKLEEVYKAIANNLMYTQTKEELFSGYEKGIESVIKRWYQQKYLEETQRISNEEAVREALIGYIKTQLNSYDSSSFKNAVAEAFLAILDKRDSDFENIIAWIKGENPPATIRKKYKIFEKIDKSTAFKMIRSLVQWTQDIGYSGLIVLMDEAEQKTSMSSQQKNILLNNLRELIDECGRTNFKHTMWYYAVPDELFLEGTTGVYQALNQRLETVFDAEINPTGVKLRLAPIEGIDILTDIGNKLAEIYQIAYKHEFEKTKLSQTISNIAKRAHDERFGEVDEKRRFVQKMIVAFHKLKATGEVVTAEAVNM